jgi:hypothetical protein
MPFFFLFFLILNGYEKCSGRVDHVIVRFDYPLPHVLYGQQGAGRLCNLIFFWVVWTRVYIVHVLDPFMDLHQLFLL